VSIKKQERSLAIMEKEKRYEEIPAYNQETQYVIEKAPVDMGDYFCVGLEVKDMEIDAEPNEQTIN
jgi:hypothetical protein